MNTLLSATLSGFLLQTAAKGAALFLLAVMAGLVGRKWSAARRYVLWLAAFVGVAALTVATSTSSSKNEDGYAVPGHWVDQVLGAQDSGNGLPGVDHPLPVVARHGLPHGDSSEHGYLRTDEMVSRRWPRPINARTNCHTAMSAQGHASFRRQSTTVTGWSAAWRVFGGWVMRDSLGCGRTLGVSS